MGSVRRAPQSRPGWQARYRGPDGRQHTATFGTKADARAHLAAVETDQRRGDWVDPRLARVSVADWAAEWRGTIVHLEPATIAWYDVMLRRHVLPALGTHPVGSIDQSVVRRFVADLAHRVSPRATKGAYQTLRNILATARGAGALRANPCEGIQLPRVQKREMLFLEPGQVMALAEAIRPPYGVLVTFAATRAYGRASSAASGWAGSNCSVARSMWWSRSRRSEGTSRSDPRRTTSDAP